MNYRNEIATTPELAAWYNAKYLEMGDGWNTPAEECHKHLDDLGVPFDKSRTLLDVGCGAGHFIREAHKRATCTGLEISVVGLDYATARCAPNSGVRWIRASIDDALWAEYADAHAVGPFDYITSIGSLEHIVDLDLALDHIRRMLKPTGKFYFYCPNERWQYFDQPNERTMTDDEWRLLFAKHGLATKSSKRWGDNQDNTAFIGVRDDSITTLSILTPTGVAAVTKLNCGSGQRPFQQAHGWCNIDIQDKYGPDVIADWNDLSIFYSNSMDLVVAHHTIEHVGCGEAAGFVKEAHRVLKPGGSLLVFVPNMQALAQRWLMHQMDDQLYFTNVYGAFMGNESDRHHWGFTWKSLHAFLDGTAEWKSVRGFDWRPVPGADLSRDWWVLSLECVK